MTVDYETVRAEIADPESHGFVWEYGGFWFRENDDYTVTVIDDEYYNLWTHHDWYHGSADEPLFFMEI